MIVHNKENNIIETYKETLNLSPKAALYEKAIKDKEKEILQYCLSNDIVCKYQQLIKMEQNNPNSVYNSLISNTLYDFKIFTEWRQKSEHYFYSVEALACFISMLQTKKVHACVTFHWNKVNIDSVAYYKVPIQDAMKVTDLDYIEITSAKKTNRAVSIVSDTIKNNTVYKVYLGNKSKTLVGIGKTTDEANDIAFSATHNLGYYI